MYRRISPFDELFLRSFSLWPSAVTRRDRSLLPDVTEAGEASLQPADTWPDTALRGWVGVVHPPVESFMRGDELVVRAELPGVAPDQIEVKAEGRHLVLRGEKREEKRSGEGEPFLREITRGRFERSFLMPQEAELDKLKATYSDGVLEITCPAGKLIPSARRIPVESKTSHRLKDGDKDVKAA